MPLGAQTIRRRIADPGRTLGAGHARRCKLSAAASNGSGPRRCSCPVAGKPGASSIWLPIRVASSPATRRRSSSTGTVPCPRTCSTEPPDALVRGVSIGHFRRCVRVAGHRRVRDAFPAHGFSDVITRPARRVAEPVAVGHGSPAGKPPSLSSYDAGQRVDRPGRCLPLQRLRPPRLDNRRQRSRRTYCGYDASLRLGDTDPSSWPLWSGWGGSPLTGGPPGVGRPRRGGCRTRRGGRTRPVPG